jgi:hypothetical protein
MAIRTVYNRDGSVYGEIDTNDYVFNNSSISSTEQAFDVDLYPYVKVDGVFFINDGLPWGSKRKARNAGDSAVMMSIFSAYR